jgi:hypothetical protein
MHLGHQHTLPHEAVIENVYFRSKHFTTLSQLQEVILDVIQSAKYYNNMGTVLSGYRAMGKGS